MVEKKMPPSVSTAIPSRYDELVAQEHDPPDENPCTKIAGFTRRRRKREQENRGVLYPFQRHKARNVPAPPLVRGVQQRFILNEKSKPNGKSEHGRVALLRDHGLGPVPINLSKSIIT